VGVVRLSPAESRQTSPKLAEANRIRLLYQIWRAKTMFGGRGNTALPGGGQGMSRYVQVNSMDLLQMQFATGLVVVLVDRLITTRIAHSRQPIGLAGEVKLSVQPTRLTE
jgi:hypothetical protein